VKSKGTAEAAANHPAERQASGDDPGGGARRGRVKAGEQLRVEALGPGRIVLTRAEDSFDELIGAVGDDVYPPDHLDKLRGEWEQRSSTPRS
jgi:hypothetical protein